METKEKETELVQLVRQLRDYVILDRKDYEKLVHNSSPEKFNESALESRDAQIKLLEQQLAHQSDVKVIYIGTGQFQLASGKWVDAILYKYRGVYKMMEASEFIRLAEQDKSTTLDRIGDIIGTGYTPNIDPDKEEHNLPETEKYF